MAEEIQKDIDTFVSLGADPNHCWLSRLGVLSDSYQFDENSTYDHTVSFSQICDRKRQYLIQDFDNVDFIGRMEYGKFSNRTNYKGEMSREKLNTEITKYSNFILLSSVENATPLVVKEALICGLGVVVSEQVSIELDTDLEFIDVLKIDIEGKEGELLLATSKATMNLCRYITLEYDQHANDLGAIVEKLVETHQIKAVGAHGGMIFAKRY